MNNPHCCIDTEIKPPLLPKLKTAAMTYNQNIQVKSNEIDRSVLNLLNLNQFNLEIKCSFSVSVFICYSIDNVSFNGIQCTHHHAEFKNNTSV